MSTGVSVSSVRRKALPWCAIVLLIVLPARADAHRLNEYLQATRVSVAADRIGLEMDLSPGVNVADGIIRAIDTDQDGRISDGEADAYASRVMHALNVSVDGRPVSLRLEARAFPAVDDMRQGIGTIRLAATVSIVAGAGHHQLVVSNRNQPEISAYLINALVTSDRRVTLRGQRRDPLQRTYTLEYDVAGARPWIGWSGAALAMIGLLWVGRRRR